MCIYIDGILESDLTADIYLQSLEVVLMLFEEASVRLKPNKSFFMLPCMKYLGFYISEAGL